MATAAGRIGVGAAKPLAADRYERALGAAAILLLAAVLAAVARAMASGAACRASSGRTS